MVRLSELIEKPKSGEWGIEGEKIKVIRTTNFTNEGSIDFTNVVYRDISNEKIAKKKLHKGDIIIEKSGGSPSQPVGRVVFFNEEEDYLYNNFTSLLRPKKKRTVEKYIFWFLFYYYKSNKVLKFQNKTTGIINLKLNDYVDSINVPLPPLAIQQQIVTILDKADRLRQLDKTIEEKYDALAQSIFIDMFGDPVKNEKGWEVKKLGEFFSMLVDVGSNGGNDWVSANINMKDDEDFAIMVRTVNLSNNDFCKNLKFVTETTYNLFKKTKVYGGEIIMNKIGSAGEYWIMPNLERPVSLGLNQLMFSFSELNEVFFYHYFKTSFGRSLIKSKLRGAITKSITKGALKELDIYYPPIELQHEFAKKIAIINQMKEQEMKGEELFQALLQKAFKGELVS